MSTSDVLIESLQKKHPARKRGTAAKRATAKPRKAESANAWAAETFKRIEALQKALDGKRLA